MSATDDKITQTATANSGSVQRRVRRRERTKTIECKWWAVWIEGQSEIRCPTLADAERNFESCKRAWADKFVSVEEVAERRLILQVYEPTGRAENMSAAAPGRDG